ncbi:hypothetical protein [Ochrobactrum sp. BTU1]
MTVLNEQACYILGPARLDKAVNPEKQNSKQSIAGKFAINLLTAD